MEQRPRRLLKQISHRTGLNWTKRGGMIIVGEEVAAKLTSFEDDLKTGILIDQLLATSVRRARLRLS
jgi:hypothetical protein